MQTSIKFFALAFVALLLTSCDHSNTPSKQVTPSDKVETTRADTSGKHTNAGMYICPMDPEIVSDKPGICPKCNMDLQHKDSVNTEQ